MKVLIIDDSQTMRRLLTAYLNPLAHDIREAEDGQQALSLLAQHEPFDLALVDWDMPVMDGLEFVRNVRRDPRHNTMKVMMVTSQNTYETVVQAIEAGAAEFLMKPLNRDMLRDKLRVLGLTE